MVRLNHDDGASYFFGVALVGLYAIPATFVLLRGALAKQGKGRTLGEQLKKQRDAAAGKNKSKVGTYVHTAFLALLWVLMGYMIMRIMQDAAVAEYNPYTILGIETGSEMRAIKKAYRKLSLENHPDKGGDEDTFMAIGKAYEALTDPVARENYEKFGNPDGRQALQVSIGLPSFLTEQENFKYVLLCYLGLIVVLVPIALSWARGSNKDEKQKEVSKETHNWVRSVLREGQNPSHLPHIVGGAVETFSGVPVDEAQDEKWLATVKQAVERRQPGALTEFKGHKVAKKKGKAAQNGPPLPEMLVDMHAALVWAHLLRIPLHEVVDPYFLDRARAMQTFVLDNLPLVMGATAQWAIFGPVDLKKVLGKDKKKRGKGKAGTSKEEKERKRREKEEIAKQRGKKLQWMDSFLTCVQFTRMVQRRVYLKPALESSLYALLQLEGATEAVVKAAAQSEGRWLIKGGGVDEEGGVVAPAGGAAAGKSGAGKPENFSFRRYLNMRASERRGLDALAPGDRAHVLRQLSELPNIHMDVAMYVDDEEEIIAEDRVTMRIKMTHVNMLEGTPVYNALYRDSADAAIAGGAAGGGGLMVVGGGGGGGGSSGSMELTLPEEALAVAHRGGETLDRFGRMSWPVTKKPEDWSSPWEKQPVPPTYAPYFPREVQERWWVLVYDWRDVLLTIQPVPEATRVMKAALQLQVPPEAGSYTYRVEARCTSAVGVDVVKHVTVEVAAKPEGGAVVSGVDGDAEEDTLMAGDGMTLEAMFTGGEMELVNDSDDEEEEEEGAGEGGEEENGAEE